MAPGRNPRVDYCAGGHGSAGSTTSSRETALLAGTGATSARTRCNPLPLAPQL